MFWLVSFQVKISFLKPLNFLSVATSQHDQEGQIPAQVFTSFFFLLLKVYTHFPMLSESKISWSNCLRIYFQIDVDRVWKFQKDQTDHIPTFTQGFFFFFKLKNNNYDLQKLSFVAPGVLRQSTHISWTYDKDKKFSRTLIIYLGAQRKNRCR